MMTSNSQQNILLSWTWPDTILEFSSYAPGVADVLPNPFDKVRNSVDLLIARV